MRDCFKITAKTKEMVAKMTSVVKTIIFLLRLAQVKFGEINIAPTQPADKFINKSARAFTIVAFAITNLE